MKVCSLTENYLFGKAYSKGESFVGKYAVVYCLKKYRTDKLKLGITVNKKLGIAVERNRAKRVIREAFCELVKEFELKPYVIVVVARTRCLSKTTKTQNVYIDLKNAVNALNMKQEKS